LVPNLFILLYNLESRIGEKTSYGCYDNRCACNNCWGPPSIWRDESCRISAFIGQIKVNDDTNTSNPSLSLNVNGTVVTIPNNPLFVLGGFIGILGAMLIVLGIANFVVAWGLLKRKGWAWIVTIIINIISAVLNIVSIVAGSIGSIGGLIINGIIIYYLYRPNVKSYFGRIKATNV
jgi:uncharacterized membrane protein (DUF2068 family)